MDHGIGIIADTDTWTVKIMAASKSFQTSDVMIYGSGVCQPAKCVKQMLSSVKNMHSTRMPPDFVSWQNCIVLCVIIECDFLIVP